MSRGFLYSLEQIFGHSEYQDVLAWLRELGMPKASIDDGKLAKWAPQFEGDGVLLPDGNLFNHAPFSLLDEGWAWAAFGYVLLFMRPGLKPDFATTPAEIVIADSEQITLAIIGDWGTGSWDDAPREQCPADQVMERVVEQDADFTIHLGDVYHLGCPQIEKESFVDSWKPGRRGSFALNSNHEMYAWASWLLRCCTSRPAFRGTARYQLLQHRVRRLANSGPRHSLLRPKSSLLRRSSSARRVTSRVPSALRKTRP